MNILTTQHGAAVTATSRDAEGQIIRRSVCEGCGARKTSRKVSVVTTFRLEHQDH